ncbi:hypothetical protein BGX26_002101, partial [Mortierella sp. AD094]
MDYGRTNSTPCYGFHFASLKLPIPHGSLYTDGLDEIATPMENDDSLREFLEHLLKREYVVATSRPSGLGMPILPKFDLELETVGFSTQNVKDYLAHVLKPEEARAVQEFIEQAPFIQDLANIPVQLDVIAYSWVGPHSSKDSAMKGKDSATMTKLYQMMVRKLWCKDAVRLGKRRGGEALTPLQINELRSRQIDELMDIEIEYLGFLALKGMQDDYQIEFDEEKLRDAIDKLDQHRGKADKDILPLQLLDTLNQTSFLHTADSDKDDSKQEWHFLHLTFQEYFAATWLARHLQAIQLGSTNKSVLEMNAKETTDFVISNKYNPQYEIVWWMVAGQLKEKALKLFFDLLQGEPPELIGGRHQRLLAGCLKEARPQLTEEVVKGLEDELEKWLRFELQLCGNRNTTSILGGQNVFPEELPIKSFGLNKKNKTDREYCLRTLRGRSNLTSYAIEYLSELLDDEDPKIKGLAVGALRAHPGNISMLLEQRIQAVTGALQRDYNNNAKISADKASSLVESTIQAPAESALESTTVSENPEIDTQSMQPISSEPTIDTHTKSGKRGSIYQVFSDQSTKSLGVQATRHQLYFPVFIRALGLRSTPEFDIYSMLFTIDGDSKGRNSTPESSRVGAICKLVMKLPKDDMERLYRDYLFRYSCAHSLSFYIRENQFCYYSERGSGQLDISREEMEKLKSAFKSAQDTNLKDSQHHCYEPTSTTVPPALGSTNPMPRLSKRTLTRGASEERRNNKRSCA